MKKSIVYDGHEPQSLELQSNTVRDAAMLAFLTQFITDERKQRFEEVLDYRTRHLTVVLEDIFQPHNASAVLRSCELRGIQDVHIVENNNRYDVNPDVVRAARNGSICIIMKGRSSTRQRPTNGCMRRVTRLWQLVRIATISRLIPYRSTSPSLWSSAPKNWVSLTMLSNMPTCTFASRCTASRRVTTSACRRPC